MSGQATTPPLTSSANTNQAAVPTLSQPPLSKPNIPPTSQQELLETIKLSEIEDPNLRAFLALRDPTAQKKLIEMAMKGNEVLKLEKEKEEKEKEELKNQVLKEKDNINKIFEIDPYLKKILEEGTSAMEKGQNPLNNESYAVMSRCYKAFHDSERLFNEQNQALKKMKQEDNSFFKAWDQENNGRTNALKSESSSNANTNNNGSVGSGVYADTGFWGTFGL